MLKKYLTVLGVILLVCSCNPSEDELFKEGIAALERQELNKSISYFDRITSENQAHSGAWNAKGVAYFELDNLDSAIVAFSRSITLDSANYKPYFNRGNALMEKEDFKAAIIDYNRANGLDLGQIDVYYNRGLALLAMEMYEDALVDFDVAIQGNPNQAQVHFNKAKALLGNNDPRGAISSLQEAIKLDETYGPAFYLLGVTEMSALGEEVQGCAHLKTALNLGFTQAKEWVDEFCKEK
ncbi:MAG: tetratricopeptide repeat protein [Cyclobacteriaceae bacterium]